MWVLLPRLSRARRRFDACVNYSRFIGTRTVARGFRDLGAGHAYTIGGSGSCGGRQFGSRGGDLVRHGRAPRWLAFRICVGEWCYSQSVLAIFRCCNGSTSGSMVTRFEKMEIQWFLVGKGAVVLAARCRNAAVARR
ncbi:hypothetical protein LR48_Vigan04g217500 [Vigna angularis]|uniref:Uncharacterized protein n=1 Tax=Phaseolus angularis TaxID=3914 RepID=A0A0L9UHE6_PHAAN|nr:hypothetical protein LR48_Vigan04g217500 [Vigna angularis]